MSDTSDYIDDKYLRHDALIRSEIFGAERLEQYAQSLATELVISRRPILSGLLEQRLRDNDHNLHDAYRILSKAIKDNSELPPAAEWLVDNYFVLEEQIRDIRNDLPPSYYRKLPKLAEGHRYGCPLAGYPRVYALALAFTAHTDSFFNATLLELFIRAYQTHHSLNISELWAITITLRVALVENLRRAAVLVINDRKARAEADTLADTLLQLAEKAPDAVELGHKYIDKAPLSSAFAVQLIQRLRDRDARAIPFLQHLDEVLHKQGTSAEQAVRDEHQNQGALTVTVRNIITSMRLISTFDWVEFFEKVSLVDECLRAQSQFGLMDLPTRNLYRRAIEKLARRSGKPELDVAKAALQMAQMVTGTVEDRSRDPGYYLIDKGRQALEAAIGYRMNWRDSIRRTHPTVNFALYMLANMVLVACLIKLGLTGTVRHKVELGTLFILSAAVFFPAWEAAITLVNRLVIILFPPAILPGMALREGVPQSLRTIVVVPVLLGNLDDVNALINQLHVHYLSNSEGDLRFALLSDWADADQEVLPQDHILMDAARQQIDALNAAHAMPDGSPRFYLLHRRRQWNASQGKWMGWERKRGKLHELNRLLRGATDTSFVFNLGQQDMRLPDHVRYVVTLDADTRLPRGAIKRMVGKLAHPLNRARLDPDRKYVTEGYGILQPRVSSSLPERHTDSLFQRVFYSASGIDPYAFAISDVYQDLFDEGSYTGKGIYDLDAFEASIALRIPENAVLSHDLIEGIYARAGLVSDIEVIEEFPSRYDVASKRQHRWARGDWQLLPWVFGRHSSSVPAIGHWKMLDNLRRTFTAPFTMLALLVGWTFPLGAASLWTVVIVVTLATPLLLPFIESLVPRRGAARAAYLMNLTLDASRAGQRVLFLVAFLPHQAWLMMDAICRSIWRLTVTHKNLLEWITAAEAKVSNRRTVYGFYRYMVGGIILTVLAVVILILASSPMWPIALPFIALWLAAPALAYYASLPVPQRAVGVLDPLSQKKLRLIARETWRFFEHFVTAEDNWLPPDNFQEDPEPVVAHRTSPTNMGLYLLATASACDFGWIDAPNLLRRVTDTYATFAAMERFRGHFFNWYATTDLRPLEPRYISSVDSGNLAGYLLVMHRLCGELASQPIIAKGWIDGIRDSLDLARESLGRAPVPVQGVARRYFQEQYRAVKSILRRYDTTDISLGSAYRGLTELAVIAEQAVVAAEAFAAERQDKTDPLDHNALLRAQEFRASVNARLETLDYYAPWLALMAQNPDLMATLPQDVVALLNDASPSFDQLPALCNKAEALLADRREAPETAALLPLLRQSAHNARQFMATAQDLARQSMAFFREMDFRFLLDPRRKLLSIGYQVNDNTLDPSCYDLLASEARLASIVAIAKGDILAHSWFRLGRTVTSVDHRPALVSWSGSMFEYLMPSLVMHEPDESLIGLTNRMIVRRQIAYGQERGIPWGVSESAYNARDYEFTYQYSSFGVPGLGLKRGLGDNIVIAPYATALAAMIEPAAALDNYLQIANIGGRGEYGWYEAVDFTRKRLPEAEKRAVVRCYMAHHQGMSVVAIHNVLTKGLMRDRFHAEPLIQATELLLQELPPRNVALAHPRFEEVEAISHIREISPIHPRCFKSPHGPTPNTHLMSNGEYAVMVTASGSGYSHWRGAAVTRWREDATRDQWGSYIYIRDCADTRFWSAGYQPSCVEPDSYNVAFLEDRAEIMRRDRLIQSTFNILVTPEDHGEVRRVSLVNQGDDIREIELTSYAELALGPQAADVAHPVFAKLFIETEYVQDCDALLATRRRRAPDEPEIWAVHLVSIGGTCVGAVEYETDRARFLGRNHTVRNPVAMDGRVLSGTVGYVLDPVFSLRCRVKLLPGTTTHISFWTLTASSRQEALHLVDKYRTPSAYNRAAARAWTQAQLQYQHLGINPEEAHLFQRLANAVIYSDATLRANPENLRKGAAAQNILWSAGISGDVPIVLMRIDVAIDLKTVRQLVKAHGYWAMKRLEVDLVILNEQPSSYLQDLQNEIELLVRTSQALPRAASEGVKGKVQVIRGDQISPEARGLLHAAARVIIVGHRGSLAEQLVFLSREDTVYLTPRSRRPLPHSHPAQIDRPALEFFNGVGGFAEDGREYVTLLEAGQETPVPWINVVANPDFGFHVSADGAGYTWSGNSRENKLTPWSNDPVGDEPGEIIYLRDVDSGAIWTPVASPIRRPEASYMARHGMGYSRFDVTLYDIETRLTQFVPLTDPVKISRLKIRNRSSAKRKLSLTSFTEWVLGPVRQNPACLTMTERDAETGALMAANYWTAHGQPRVAFAHIVGTPSMASNMTWTGDRREFIGRNGALAYPAALIRGKTLSGKLGAGFDPCAALQTVVDLLPGQEIEITVLLGEAADQATARTLVKKYSSIPLDVVFNEITSYWRKLVGGIQVRTPDRAMDIMLNGWLVYQTIVCRIWARSGFYQSSGAYGYRDQLQDVMNVTAHEPHWTREHLLRAAGRQFVEGDMQHWWLPSQYDAGRGVRTRFSDDPLWLPFVAAYYIKLTGDKTVLDEQVPFLEGRVLEPHEHESFFMPEISGRTASLFEHCALAIERTLTAGPHGISLFGGGDWNDGMNRVGVGGQGESVWLAWFLLTVIRDFTVFAAERAPERLHKWQQHAEHLKQALEDNAWDGNWYRRGYYDDGTPLGSAHSDECRIDSIAQSWSVISGAGRPDRRVMAMQSLENYLVKPADELALLFTPAFNHTPKDPGYIKGYPPGIRENGGQYTHAAIWTVMALAVMGQGNQAYALYDMLNPVQHARTAMAVQRYKVEPYVIAADIYANPQHVGRGGWTWYTGSAGWMYRAGLESILGFQLCAGGVVIHPCIPDNWPAFEVDYLYKSTPYHFHIDNKSGRGHTIVSVEYDGKPIGKDSFIALTDDRTRHDIRIVLG